LVAGGAIAPGSLVGGAPALGLGAGVEGAAEGAGSSGLQPTTTIIANTALASSEKALMPIFAITDALLDVEHVTSRIVTFEFPIDTDNSTASRKIAPAVLPDSRPLSGTDYRGNQSRSATRYPLFHPMP
jgi:hypothetical protein